MTPPHDRTTGRWFQTESGMFGQFMPSSFIEDRLRRQSSCMEEITADFTGRTQACARPAVAVAFDVFAGQHYPVCRQHS